MPSPTHLISKVGDPIFALFIGLSAAATRINREEKELGRSTQQTIDAGLRYVSLSQMNDAKLMVLLTEGSVSLSKGILSGSKTESGLSQSAERQLWKDRACSSALASQ